MLTRQLRLAVSRLLLGAVLLGQAAYVIAACGWMERSPAMAVLHAADNAPPPCHESVPATAEGPLCLSHCMASVQSLDKPAFAAPVVATAPVLLAVPKPVDFAGSRASQVPPAGPPPRILFRSLQI